MRRNTKEGIKDYKKFLCVIQVRGRQKTRVRCEKERVQMDDEQCKKRKGGKGRDIRTGDKEMMGRCEQQERKLQELRRVR